MSKKNKVLIGICIALILLGLVVNFLATSFTVYIIKIIFTYISTAVMFVSCIFIPWCVIANIISSEKNTDAIIFKGNDRFAYRDPACFYKDGTYYLFFTVSEKDNGYMYNRIGLSKSTDLKNWTEPEILTEKNYNTNYCSPGNVIEKDGEYILCFTSYPMPYPFKEKSWANENARLFTMKTKDFKTFTEPELLNPKTGTPNSEIGRMIDPFLIKKGDYYYIYFKQNGVSYSRSKDLVNWEFIGNTKGGENACVTEKDGGYLLIHSPENGIGFAKSEDLEKWEDMGSTTLKQDEWEWAQGRLTAAFAMEAPKDFKYKYIIFFHGSKNVFPETHGNATVAMTFTDNFEEFYYEI